MVCSTFSPFFHFNLRIYILQCAKKCEMTSFCMTSLHVYLNEAAECVDVLAPTLLIPYRTFAHLYKIQNGDDIWPNLRRLIVEFMKVRGMKAWKELTTGVQQLVRLLFGNNFINPGLFLYCFMQIWIRKRNILPNWAISFSMCCAIL